MIELAIAVGYLLAGLLFLLIGNAAVSRKSRIGFNQPVAGFVVMAWPFCLAIIACLTVTNGITWWRGYFIERRRH